MKKRAAGLVLCAGLSLSCCSLFKSRIPSYPSGLLFPVEETFSVEYGGEIAGLIQKNDGSLYFSTRNGQVVSIDGPGKKTRWIFKTQSECSTPPCLGESALSIYDSANILYRLDFQGRLLWKQTIDARITTRVREYRGVLYLGTERGEILALDSSGGSEIWRFKSGGLISSAPAFWENQILFGCEDGNIYFISSSGKPVTTFDAGSRVDVAPLVSENRLYFGTADGFYYCLDLKSMKKKWKIKLNGRICAETLADERRLFFLTTNNVLYSLKKKSGEILWWQALPSHSVYNPEMAGDKIVATSFSAELTSVDLKTGKKAGDYKAPGELKSNALWMAPYLLLSIYDFLKQEGELIYLVKQVKVHLNPAKTSPQKVGDEVLLTGSSVGFFRPLFEFYVKEGETSEVVQKESEKDSCVWFPQKEGTFSVGVRVRDEKEKAMAEIPYVIEKKEEPKKKDLEKKS